jgi:hypothetical protein
MPKSVSDYFGIDHETFDATGAFDAILDVDSRLFIDPQLLRTTTVPEFSTAAASIERRFTRVMRLLARSEKRGDPFWRWADRYFRFPELRGLCIGYSSRSTAGSGMGQGLRARLLETATEIIRAGVDDPAFFEWMGLLEEGIGADRISDMIGRIAQEEVYAYSERVFDDLGVSKEERWTYTVGERTVRLPRNPFNNAPVLLVPREVLRSLPVAEDWSEIDAVIAFNADLRARVNALIGTTWKKARKLPKSTLRQRLIQDPGAFKELLAAYRGIRAKPYDEALDPHGEVRWYRAARTFTDAFPLELLLPKEYTAEDAMAVVIKICQHYAQLIEDNGLSRFLYEPDGTPSHESAAQLLFFGIASGYCEANNLPETDSGRGEVDFKFSRGFRIKIVVESKLTSNENLEHGLTVQLEEYAKAERTDQRVYLVIDVEKEGSAARLGRFKEIVKTKQAAGKNAPVVVYVNGRPKASASKYKPPKPGDAK